MRLVSSSAALTDLVPDTFWSISADARVSLRATHDMLERGSERLGDDRLGLKLGNTMAFGSGGSFDYAVRSANTLRDSMLVASKYSSLLTDSFHLSVEDHADETLVRVEDDVSLPTSAADFAMSALFKLHVAESLPASHVECWFPYAEPNDIGEHRRIFAGARLKFGAPFCGFAFDRAEIQVPRPGVDPILHAMLLSRVDSLLEDLRAARPLSVAVRRLIEKVLPDGDTTADGIARALHMSRRTLTRRLDLEHTSYQAELDAVRQRIAFDRLRDPRSTLAEAAFFAGFSHVESFHRAFRRWTGQTPGEFRSTEAGDRMRIHGQSAYSWPDEQTR